MLRSAFFTLLLMIAVLNDGSLFLPSAAPVPDKHQTGMFTTAAPLNPVSDVNRLARYASMGLTQTPVQRTQPISQVHPDAAPFLHINSADVANHIPSFNPNDQAAVAASGTETRPNVSGMSAPTLSGTNNAILNSQQGMMSSGGATRPIKVSGMSAPVSLDTSNAMSMGSGMGSGMTAARSEVGTGTAFGMSGTASGSAGNEQMPNSVSITAGSKTSPPGSEGVGIGNGTPGMNYMQGPPSSTSSEISGNTGTSSMGNEKTPSSIKPITPGDDMSARAPEGEVNSAGNVGMNEQTNSALVPPTAGTNGSAVDQITGGAINHATPQGEPGWPTQHLSSGQETEPNSSAGQGSGPPSGSSGENQ